MNLDKNTRFVVKIETYAKHKDDEYSTLLKTEEKEVVGNECIYDIPARLLSDNTVTYKTITPIAIRTYKPSSQSRSMVELDEEFIIKK